jgi:DNA-binding transcriptional regulator YhcF (GntR family)
MIPYDLLADISLTRIKNPTAKIIFLCLARYSNSSGQCFPSQIKLSEDACVSERTTRNCLQWLEEHGYIEVTQRVNKSNLYTITVMKEEDMNEQAKSAAEVDNITKLDINKRKSITSYAAKSAAPDENPFFLSFWEAYPRRIGRGEARVAFAKACRHSDGNTIVQAAIAYARHCNEMKIEPKFRPHPATWLNQERWADDLEGEKETQNNSGWGNALDGL